MGIMSQKTKATIDEMVGTATEKVGELTGNPKLQARGQARRTAAIARKEAAKAGARLKGTGEEIKGTIKEKAGDLLDRPVLQAKGAAEKAQGTLRREANK